ncbi:MAG: CotH kinase family protein [Haliscomenobacter sp.]|nr:CotH kinase family protein [Haliscomenobacter sp.]
MARFLFLLLSFFAMHLSLTGQGLYDKSRFSEIRIYFKEKNWQEALDSLRDSPGEGRLTTAYVAVNGKKYPGAGVRYKGNSSFNNVRRSGQDKLPFNIKINHTQRELLLPGGYSTLKLANGFRDPSMVREVFAYEVAGTYIPAPRAAYAKVFVNDAYWGVYTSTESVDKPFLLHHFADTTGSLIKGEPDWKWKRPASCPDKKLPSLNYLGEDTLCYQGIYEVKGEKAWDDLIEFTRTLNQNPAAIEQILDVSQMLWMLAINNVLVNLDSYVGGFAQNYYLYRDSTGIFHPVIWDLNLAFGGFRLLTEKDILSDEALQHFSPFAQYKERNPDKPLLIHLLDNELNRKIYTAYCRTILEDFFYNDAYLSRLEELQDFLEADVSKDPNYFYPRAAFRDNLSMSVQAHGEKIMGITELMHPRIAYFQRHPLVSAPAPVIETPIQEMMPNGRRITARVSGAKRVWLFYSENAQSGFRRLPMTAEASDPELWSAEALMLPGGRFYVAAENDLTAALSPRTAGQNAYIAK